MLILFIYYAISELWLEWLKDEMKYAETTDRAKVNSLFERAVTDYVCMYYCTVWCSQLCVESVAHFDFFQVCLWTYFEHLMITVIGISIYIRKVGQLHCKMSIDTFFCATLWFNVYHAMNYDVNCQRFNHYISNVITLRYLTWAQYDNVKFSEISFIGWMWTLQVTEHTLKWGWSCCNFSVELQAKIQVAKRCNCIVLMIMLFTLIDMQTSWLSSCMCAGSHG